MVAYLLGKSARHQEDLLPVLQKHRHEILFTDSYNSHMGNNCKQNSCHHFCIEGR